MCMTSVFWFQTRKDSFLRNWPDEHSKNFLWRLYNLDSIRNNSTLQKNDRMQQIAFLAKRYLNLYKFDKFRACIIILLEMIAFEFLGC